MEAENLKQKILFIFILLLLNLIFKGCGSDSTTNTNNNTNTAPNAPTLISPPNGSIDSLLTPTFNWNASTGASSYRIQIATDSAFINIVNVNTTSATTYTIASGILLPSTSYRWRVKAINEYGESDYSSVWSFQTVGLNTITGRWVLVYAQGTLDICPGEIVLFPNNTGGTAELTCPNQNTIYRQYTVNGSTLTYTTSGVRYSISFNQNSYLVLTGINLNRTLYYDKVITDIKSTSIKSQEMLNSSD